MAKAFSLCGYDALAWNFRGCSGEPNRQARTYHSGATDDLNVVIAHCLSKNQYDDITLVGFSLGANLMLKYLGEQSARVSPLIKKAVAFSAPCDLGGSSERISSFANRIYERRFLASLKSKIVEKAARFPNQISLEPYNKKQIRTLRDFDDFYTSKLHGFENASDYYAKCSSKQFLSNIAIPTLLVNAKNDLFLSPSCFPFDEARSNPALFLETPDSGGHLGFITEPLPHGLYWSEMRALGFAASWIEVLS
jgi:predicted alpha/beta-fold hydrolase